MKAYKYNVETKEYIGQVDCQLNPIATKREGHDVFLTPANAVLIAPTEQEGYASVWNGETWENIVDKRGVKYWLPTDKHGDQPRDMKDLGELPDGATLTEPSITIDEAKASKIAEFKQKRDSEETANIEYNGNIYDYDEKARERLQIARQSLADSGIEGASIVWTTADNQRVTLTVQDFAGINSAAAFRSNALHIKYNTLKEAVNACTTVEAVNAIEW